jgi:hypothetical protein
MEDEDGAMMTGDPIEQIMADALAAAGIRFIHDSDDKKATKALDFLLPDLGIFIEVKQFHSDRIAEQMSRAENVIAIQGRRAAEAFAEILAAAQAGAVRDAAIEAARAYRTAESDDTPRMWRGKALQDLANDLDDKLEAVAQAGDTRRAETGTGSVHEHAVGEADAP